MQPIASRIASSIRLAAALLLSAAGCAGETPEAPQQPANDTPLTAPLPEAQPATTPTVPGKVVSITDGDTIVVLVDREQVTVRLEGIDCPESGQKFGAKAKQAASELCFGKPVELKVTGEDRYGRTLADVILPDGRNLSQELVRTGFAWWFRKYSDDKTLMKLEADARGNKRGLWADPQAVAPWDWRASRRAKLDVPLDEIEIVPNGVAIVALLPNPKGEDAGNEQVTLGNSTSEVIDLSGWKLIDTAGNVFLLSGRLEPGETIATMTEATMPLNNDGDTVILIDSEGVGRSRVSYSASQAGTGAVFRFAD